MKTLLQLLIGLSCLAQSAAADNSPAPSPERGSASRSDYVPNFGPAEFVQAGGTDIVVPGYSVPSFAYWNDDDLRDLIVGEGVAEFPGKVRVYLNVGTQSSPAFAGFFYAQSLGADLEVPAEGCMGAFPRVVYWDRDARKDLLIGRPDGLVALYLNVGTDSQPTFDGGQLLQVGDDEEEVDISVYYRAAPTTVDWNNDGNKDLVVGSVDGLIYLFINEDSDTSPLFLHTQYAMMDDETLLAVPSTRSSPVVLDMDGDGRKDLLVGDREGQLLFYRNTATDAAPAFAPYTLAQSEGVPIDLPDLPRARPFVCDWTGDGLHDVLVGSEDGTVRLYQGLPTPGDLDQDGDCDLDDLAMFAIALAGPEETTPPPGCDPALFAAADFDADGDVDLADFLLFQVAFTGTGM